MGKTVVESNKFKKIYSRQGFEGLSRKISKANSSHKYSDGKRKVTDNSTSKKFLEIGECVISKHTFKLIRKNLKNTKMFLKKDEGTTTSDNKCVIENIEHVLNDIYFGVDTFQELIQKLIEMYITQNDNIKQEMEKYLKSVIFIISRQCHNSLDGILNYMSIKYNDLSSVQNKAIRKTPAQLQLVQEPFGNYNICHPTIISDISNNNICSRYDSKPVPEISTNNTYTRPSRLEILTTIPKTVIAFYCDRIIHRNKYLESNDENQLNFEHSARSVNENEASYSRNRRDYDGYYPAHKRIYTDYQETTYGDPPRIASVSAPPALQNAPESSFNTGLFDNLCDPKYEVVYRRTISFWEGLFYCLLLWIPVCIIAYYFYIYVLTEMLEPDESTNFARRSGGSLDKSNSGVADLGF